MGDRFTEQLEKLKEGGSRFWPLFQKIAYHPMLWAALGVHALFALIPMGGNSTTTQTTKAKDPEPVKLTTLAGAPTQKKPTPRAKPKTPAPPIAKPKVATPRRRQVVSKKPPALQTKPTRPPTKPKSETQPAPTETPTPNSNKPLAPPLTDTTTTPTTPTQTSANSAPNIGGDASGASLPPEYVPFVDALTNSSGVTDVDGNYLSNVEAVTPQPDEFTGGGSDPKAFFGADLQSGVAGLVPGGFLVVGNTLPEQFNQEMTGYFTQQGYSVSPVGSYGGGQVFQATIGATTAYISTIRLKPAIGKDYTGVVLWKQPPPGL